MPGEPKRDDHELTKHDEQRQGVDIAEFRDEELPGSGIRPISAGLARGTTGISIGQSIGPMRPPRLAATSGIID